MRKTLLSLAALAALGLASAPAMAGDHGMQEHADKSMSEAKKHGEAKYEADKKRKDMEHKAKHSKDKAGKATKEKREGKREYESKAKEMMEQEGGN